VLGLTISHRIAPSACEHVALRAHAFGHIAAARASIRHGEPTWKLEAGRGKAWHEQTSWSDILTFFFLLSNSSRLCICIADSFRCVYIEQLAFVHHTQLGTSTLYPDAIGRARPIPQP
jgi:hypothetical protein